MDNSYILIAVKVPANVDEALNAAGDVVKALQYQGYDEVSVINTIPAP